MALEYAKQGIRANAVSPGSIETDMIERVFQSTQLITREQMTAAQPIGRVGKPAEIANAVVWLCSDGAAFVTGQTLAVDDGYTSQ